MSSCILNYSPDGKNKNVQMLEKCTYIPKYTESTVSVNECCPKKFPSEAHDRLQKILVPCNLVVALLGYLVHKVNLHIHSL